jgi:flagellar biosynthesis/type III secretory pathway protein FliH
MGIAQLIFLNKMEFGFTKPTEKDDQILTKLMERISKEALSADDFTYIDDYEQYLERVKRYDQGKYKEGWKDGIEKGIEQGIEKGIEQGIEKGIQQGIQQGIGQGFVQGEKRKAQRTALKLLQRQTPLEEIVEISELDIKEIQSLKQLLEKHGDRAIDFLA